MKFIMCQQCIYIWGGRALFQAFDMHFRQQNRCPAFAEPGAEFAHFGAAQAVFEAVQARYGLARRGAGAGGAQPGFAAADQGGMAGAAFGRPARIEGRGGHSSCPSIVRLSIFVFYLVSYFVSLFVSLAVSNWRRVFRESWKYLCDLKALV